MHVVKNGYTDRFAEFREIKGEDLWSLDTKHGSYRGQDTMSRGYNPTMELAGVLESRCQQHKIKSAFLKGTTRKFD